MGRKPLPGFYETCKWYMAICDMFNMGTYCYNRGDTILNAIKNLRTILNFLMRCTRFEVNFSLTNMSDLARWEPVARIYDPLKAGSIDGTDTIPHDHGIVRALEAEYKPNKLVVGDPKATIFVGCLNPMTTENTLSKSFSKYGKIKRIRLIRDIITGFSKCYAFIEYSDRYDAVEAIKKMNKRTIDDREIFVDAECERLLPGWVPRRLGGGLSGKKESGQLRFGGVERPFRKPLIPYRSREDKHEPHGHHSSRDSFNNRNPHNSSRNRYPQQSNFQYRNRERDRRMDNYSFKRKEDPRDSNRN